MHKENTQYFMVGTIYGAWRSDDKSLGNGEQIHEWIENSEWKLGWHSYLEKTPSYLRQLRVLQQVNVGDVLIAKQMDPDFKNMWVKAIGVCKRATTDGHTLGVDWVKDFTNKPLKTESSYRPTISKMSSSPNSLKIINEIIKPILEETVSLSKGKLI